jgi:cyclohexa-1,5-dienecarbonyl-CoA hydratase
MIPPNSDPKRVAWILLQNPPQNVIDIAIMEELSAALAELESREEISTIVFYGSGEHFSSGVDVAAHQPETVGEMLNKFHQVIRAVVASGKVTVAVVRGNCLGGGAELAMVCDLVYTAENAKWGFPEIKLGCFPPVAAVALAAVIGQKRAAELILSGRTITGREAAEIGLANDCGNEEELEAKFAAVWENLSRLSPASLAMAKRALYSWDAIHFDKGLARSEKIYLDELMKTEDAQEGIRAWMEKREPRWKGK